MVFTDSITVFVSCRMKIQSNTYTEVYFRSLLGQRTLRKTDKWVILKWQVEICINKTSDSYTFLELLLFFFGHSRAVLMTLFAWIVYLLCFIKSFYSSIWNIRGEGKGRETNLERLGRIMHFLTKWVFFVSAFLPHLFKEIKPTKFSARQDQYQYYGRVSKSTKRCFLLVAYFS